MEAAMAKENGGKAENAEGEKAAAADRLKNLPAHFAEIVALMMRSPVYRHMSLADLDWLVVPVLLSGQFSIMSARGKGENALRAPIGLAFWASVSSDVDRKLEAQKKGGIVPFRLAPKDWTSGKTIWLLDLIALPQARQPFLDKLIDGPFKGRTVKHYFDKPVKREKAAPAAAVASQQPS
jgi:hemolysin-activating ACP:hemolysin acyltransferase